MGATFRAVSRTELVETLAGQDEYKRFADRLLEQCKENCPVGEGGDEDAVAKHLRDTLVVKHITGADPRIMIGSVEKGDVLGYVIKGTEAHGPVTAKALRFTSGGTVVFTTWVKGVTPNDFILRSIGQILHDT